MSHRNERLVILDGGSPLRFVRDDVFADGGAVDRLVERSAFIRPVPAPRLNLRSHEDRRFEARHGLR